MQRIFQNEDGTAFLEKGFLINPDLLEKCVLEVEPLLEERPELIIFGKPCRQQRHVGFFSDESIGYTYSRKLMPSQPLSESITELLYTVNSIFGIRFNGILVNKYENGNDYISAHSDSEVGLETIGVIAISVGAERTFRIRDKQSKKIVHDELTTHCSILHMGGRFQECYTHEIPVHI